VANVECLYLADDEGFSSGSAMFTDLFSYGYVGIALFLILTGCGLPLPEEVAIITAGVLAANHRLNPWLALLACLIGAIAGDSAMYGIGRTFGEGILQRHPVWLGFLNPEREKKIEVLLRKHGAKMILLTRFLVGLRSPVYMTAGILRVPYLRFLLVDTICAIFVISMFFGLTYFYGENIWAWIRRGELAIEILVVGAIVVAGILYWLHRRSKAMLEKATAEEVKVDDAKADAAPEPKPAEESRA
jgi:membrane protein DedA with SNARE-associated domain